MAIYRVDLLCDDPDPVFDWLEKNVEPGQLVRKIGYETVKGWYLKIVFKRPADAESFHRSFYPNELDHSVPVFCAPKAVS
jgi:hypothetical protein